MPGAPRHLNSNPPGTQAGIIFVTVPLLLLRIDGYLTRRYDELVAQVGIGVLGHRAGRLWPAPCQPALAGRLWPAPCAAAAPALPAGAGPVRRQASSCHRPASLPSPPARQTPLTAVHRAGRGAVDPEVYTPPPLRPGAVGWSPEWGKVWAWWGVPRYTL